MKDWLARRAVPPDVMPRELDDRLSFPAPRYLRERWETEDIEREKARQPAPPRPQPVTSGPSLPALRPARLTLGLTTLLLLALAVVSGGGYWLAFAAVAALFVSISLISQEQDDEI